MSALIPSFSACSLSRGTTGFVNITIRSWSLCWSAKCGTSHSIIWRVFETSMGGILSSGRWCIFQGVGGLSNTGKSVCGYPPSSGLNGSAVTYTSSGPTYVIIAYTYSPQCTPTLLRFSIWCFSLVSDMGTRLDARARPT